MAKPNRHTAKPIKVEASKPRNPLVALLAAHGQRAGAMRDRRLRRPGEKDKAWRREDWG